MSNEQKLDTATGPGHSMWQDGFLETLTDEDITEAEQAQFYGRGLADLRARGQLSVADLRALAATYTALECEVIELAGTDREQFANTADYIEAGSRHLGRSALKEAIELTGSKRRLDIYIRDNGKRLGIRGPAAFCRDSNTSYT
jgi:hypothetical protein